MTARLVVFDFGGVVFRWRPEQLLARVLGPARIRQPEEALAWKDRFFQAYGGDWGEFDAGRIGVDEVRTRIAARTGLAPDEVQAVIDAVPAELQPIPGTVALIERLKAAGQALAYLSNMPLPYVAYLRAEQPVLGCFGQGVFSGEERCAKPEDRIFALAQARFGRTPPELVFIDDHPANIEAARALGWTALLFTGPDVLAADLDKLGLLPLD